jgi:hypothetical protein
MLDEFLAIEEERVKLVKAYVKKLIYRKEQGER